MVVSEYSITSSHDNSTTSLAVVFKREEPGVVQIRDDLIHRINILP
jgi:hypothetical protein